jgi:hypothetical protein
MYEIYKNQDLYQIHSNLSGFAAKECSFLALLTYTHSLGFKPDELQAALLDMLNKDHDSANFGINKTFIYSFNKREKYGRVA